MALTHELRSLRAVRDDKAEDSPPADREHYAANPEADDKKPLSFPQPTAQPQVSQPKKNWPSALVGIPLLLFAGGTFLYVSWIDLQEARRKDALAEIASQAGIQQTLTPSFTVTPHEHTTGYRPEANQRAVAGSSLKTLLQSLESEVRLPRADYFVDFNISIHPHGSLILEPGTSMYFEKDCGITANGPLYAVGMKEQPISFAPAKDSWRNITLQGGMAGKSVLRHCSISGGTGCEVQRSMRFEWVVEEQAYDIVPTYFAGGGIYIASANPIIENCRITNCQTTAGGGIALFKSSATIKDCVFENNHAFRGGGLFIHLSSPTIVANIFKDNIADKGGSISISDCLPTLQDNEIKAHIENMSYHLEVMEYDRFSGFPQKIWKTFKVNGESKQE